MLSFLSQNVNVCLLKTLVPLTLSEVREQTLVLDATAGRKYLWLYHPSTYFLLIKSETKV